MQPLLTIPSPLSRLPGRPDLLPEDTSLGRRLFARSYWAINGALLATGLTLWPPALALVLLVSDLRLVELRVRHRRWTAFPVQLQGLDVALLMLGCLEPLAFLHWLLVAESTARVVVGDSLPARLLTLLPWNR